MAKKKGGPQYYTIQEAENISLGQLGSMATDNSSDPIVAPTGHVFVAFTTLDQAHLTFTLDIGMLAEDSDRWVNTDAASSGGGGTGGEKLTHAISFPAGITVYGRWTQLDVQQGNDGLIAYIGV
jgi:hypothetical protein